MTAPRRLDLRHVPPAEADLSEAVRHVRDGGLLGYPTETVYGFGGACTPPGVEALRGLKPREADKPFLVLAPDRDSVADLAWTDAALELAGIFWPGAVTLVLSDPRRIFPPGVRGPDGSVAVRVSSHALAAALLDGLGEPLTSTSANAPGAAAAADGQRALDVARELGAGAEVLILDGGTLPPSGPSTIVDCTGAEPVVLREGTVPLGRLRCAIPGIHGQPRD